ncbi:hypothetical protein M422DRAFT_43622 [Sphaerobolus stellatus SS14]|nr:hypothetical protein M422DRAFT_43622 [Sphaerobolus stellatus SS14]
MIHNFGIKLQIRMPKFTILNEKLQVFYKSQHLRDLDLESMHPRHELTATMKLSPSPMSEGGRGIKYIPTSDDLIQHHILLWAVQTSTDLDMILLASEMVPRVFWPPGIDFQPLLIQFQYAFDRCFDIGGAIVPCLQGHARAFYIAVLYLYCVSESPLYTWTLHKGPAAEDLCGQWIFTRLEAVHEFINDSAAIVFIEHMLLPTLWSSRIDLPSRISPGDVPWTVNIILAQLAYGVRNGFVTIWEGHRSHALSMLASSPTNSDNAPFLLGLALMLGFQPELSFLALPNKSGFELQLLHEVLLRMKCLSTYRITDRQMGSQSLSLLADLMPRFPSLIRKLIPDFASNQESVPELLWLSVLKETKDSDNIFSVMMPALKILQGIVILHEDKFDYIRILKFYEVFNSRAALTQEDADRIFTAIETKPKYLEDVKLGLLLALGIVEWPAILSSNIAYVNLLISCLEAPTPVHSREVALQAAWGYRKQLESVRDEDIGRTRLLSAIITVTNIHMQPDDLIWGEKSLITSRYSRCCILIRSLCRNSVWKCAIPEHHRIAVIKDVPQHIIRYRLYDERLVASLYDMLQALKVVSTPCMGNELFEEPKPIIISVWRYICSRSEPLMGWNKDYPVQNDPFDIEEDVLWALMDPICN